MTDKPPTSQKNTVIQIELILRDLSFLAPAHPGGPGKRAVRWLCGGGVLRDLRKTYNTLYAKSM